MAGNFFLGRSLTVRNGYVVNAKKALPNGQASAFEIK